MCHVSAPKPVLCDTEQDPADISLFPAGPTHVGLPFLLPEHCFPPGSQQTGVQGAWWPSPQWPSWTSCSCTLWYVSLSPRRLPDPLKPRPFPKRLETQPLWRGGLFQVSQFFPCSLTLGPRQSSCFAGLAFSAPPRVLSHSFS